MQYNIVSSLKIGHFYTSENKTIYIDVIPIAKPHFNIQKATMNKTF